jgi:uncharacterized protein
MTDLRVDDPAETPPVATVVLAHGAGAGMDSPALRNFAAALAGAGLKVVRFEFSYMAARREGRRPPPPGIAALVPEFAAVLGTVLSLGDGPVVIGGKSMGSRVAARLAERPLDGRVVGVFALGFPFHPPAHPERDRLPDLLASRLPVLVCQGTRDPFGTRERVAGYALGPGVTVRWFEDGDHDLIPRKASGQTRAGHVAAAAAAIADFARGQARSA